MAEREAWSGGGVGPDGVGVRAMRAARAADVGVVGTVSHVVGRGKAQDRRAGAGGARVKGRGPREDNASAACVLTGCSVDSAE